MTTTPAIERAAAENPRAYGDWNVTFMSGEPVEPASVYVTRRTLAAALDVEEMAQAMATRPGGIRYLLPMYRELAAAARASILGEAA